MGDDRSRILDLLAAGKITAEEAARLLDALAIVANGFFFVPGFASLPDGETKSSAAGDVIARPASNKRLT